MARTYGNTAADADPYEAIERALRAARERTPANEGPRSREMWNEYQADREPYRNRPWRPTPYTQRDIQQVAKELGVSTDAAAQILGQLSAGSSPDNSWMNEGLAQYNTWNNALSQRGLLGDIAKTADYIGRPDSWATDKSGERGLRGEANMDADAKSQLANDQQAMMGQARSALASVIGRNEAMDDIADLERAVDDFDSVADDARSRGLAVDVDPNMTVAQLAALQSIPQLSIDTPPLSYPDEAPDISVDVETPPLSYNPALPAFNLSIDTPPLSYAPALPAMNLAVETPPLSYNPAMPAFPNEVDTPPLSYNPALPAFPSFNTPALTYGQMPAMPDAIAQALADDEAQSFNDQAAAAERSESAALAAMMSQALADRANDQMSAAERSAEAARSAQEEQSRQEAIESAAVMGARSMGPIGNTFGYGVAEREAARAQMESWRSEYEAAKRANEEEDARSRAQENEFQEDFDNVRSAIERGLIDMDRLSDEIQQREEQLNQLETDRQSLPPAPQSMLGTLGPASYASLSDIGAAMNGMGYGQSIGESFGGVNMAADAMNSSLGQMSALGLSDIGFSSPAFADLSNSVVSSYAPGDDGETSADTAPAFGGAAIGEAAADTAPAAVSDNTSDSSTTGDPSPSAGDAGGGGGGDGFGGAFGNPSSFGDMSTGWGADGIGVSSVSSTGEGAGPGAGNGWASGGYVAPDRAILRAILAAERLHNRDRKARGGYVMPFARFADGGEIVENSVEYTPNGVIYSQVVQRALSAAKRRNAA